MRCLWFTMKMCSFCSIPPNGVDPLAVVPSEGLHAQKQSLERQDLTSLPAHKGVQGVHPVDPEAPSFCSKKCDQLWCFSYTLILVSQQEQAAAWSWCTKGSKAHFFKTSQPMLNSKLKTSKLRFKSYLYDLKLFLQSSNPSYRINTYTLKARRGEKGQSISRYLGSVRSKAMISRPVLIAFNPPFEQQTFVKREISISFYARKENQIKYENCLQMLSELFYYKQFSSLL